jgi:Putative transposase
VAFTVRADDHGGKRLARLGGEEFVRRFLLNILPTGAKRIHHYGVLAPSCKRVKLAAARVALQMPAPNPQAVGSAQGFLTRVAKMDAGLCQCCKVGRLKLVASLAGLNVLPAPGSAGLPVCWGPP